jgi:hypothetical protein
MSASLQKAKGSKKNRKYGRNKKQCEVYRNENKREKNKVKRLLRHLKKYPSDVATISHLERIRKIITGANAARNRKDPDT